jgi:hypothetical protein
MHPTAIHPTAGVGGLTSETVSMNPADPCLGWGFAGEGGCFFIYWWVSLVWRPVSQSSMPWGVRTGRPLRPAGF